VQDARATAASPPAEAAAGQFYLPNLCEPLAVLVVVLVAELVAVLLTVARLGMHDSLWTDLGRTSLFLVWIALGSAATLCWLRPRLARLDVTRGSAATLALLLAVTAVVSEAAWRGGTFGPFALARFAGEHAEFVLGNLATCLIVGAIGLRYTYVAHQWRRNVEREARSRVEALQARIRPHFLYNSMNTIAALTRSDPARAETAVEDLADLFRVNLRETRPEVPFADELEIARTYERIELLRLGARLAVQWDVDGVSPETRVPSLLLQPLLENAIYHGVERVPGGGTVSVAAASAGDRVEIVVANPMPGDDADPARAGNRIALANVRERLALAYGPDASLEAGAEGGRFVVRVRLPHRVSDGAPGARR
jgi:two-component system sensor histidine kinase AlgZ